MHREKTTIDPMRVSLDNNTLCPGNTMVGRITIDKLSWILAKHNAALDDHHLCIQFHGVEKTVKFSKVLVSQQVYFRLTKDTTTTKEYYFEHTLDKSLPLSVNFNDHRIVYQVAVRLENASLDPRLVSKMPINLVAYTKAGEVSNNLYKVVVPDLVVASKSNFSVKAFNPKFSNITSVEYKLIAQDGNKTVYKNQVKLKGWNPEVDPSMCLDNVPAGKYFMKLSVKDLRTTSKFEIPLVVHQQDFLPAYSL